MSDNQEPPRRGPGRPPGTKVKSDKRLGRPPKPDSIKEQGWERFSMNLPPDLKKRLEERAARDGTHMAHVLIEAAKRYLDGED